LGDLATYCRIQATTPLNENYVFTLTSRPTPTQKRAFELLGIAPEWYPPGDDRLFRLPVL
ncbi:hypothetical protein CU669_20725, partial [Paramagnetospirillum kuznetsovii]